jgi:hypothetical protein
MTYRITEDSQRPLITVSFSGAVDDKEIMTVMDELFGLESFQTADQFIDFSGVKQYEVTPGGMVAYNEVAKTRPERSEARADRNIVLYAPDDLTFGMARLLASVADNSDIKLQVCRELSEALALIGLTEIPTESTKNGTSSA